MTVKEGKEGYTGNTNAAKDKTASAFIHMRIDPGLKATAVALAGGKGKFAQWNIELIEREVKRLTSS